MNFPQIIQHFEKRAVTLPNSCLLGAIFYCTVYPVGNKQNEQIYMQLFQVIKDGHPLSIHYKTNGCGKH